MERTRRMERTERIMIETWTLGGLREWRGLGVNGEDLEKGDSED
jgi:hypothetical protein